MVIRILSAAAFTLALSATAHAQDSVANASRAAEGSAQAAGALAESGVQTASAAAVLPASAVGGASVVVGAGTSVAGAASVAAAGDAAATADGRFGRAPLPLDRRVVVAQPARHVPYDAAPPAKP